jgi:SRSO17 transposase
LLSDLPRKTVEPIALESATAVRTLQEFLTTARWKHQHLRDLLQRHLADAIATAPADSLGTVGGLDETSCRKWGDETPGVQRQYLDCMGKVDNGIVTVHVGVTKGRFQAVLDADLYLSKAWNADRPRCQAAGIPDEVRYRPTWLMLGLVVLGFVATQTERLRGKNPRVSAEQVCRALNQRCASLLRRRRKVPQVRHVSEVICYHQRRNEQAAKSPKKRRRRCVI